MTRVPLLVATFVVTVLMFTISQAQGPGYAQNSRRVPTIPVILDGVQYATVAKHRRTTLLPADA